MIHSIRPLPGYFSSLLLAAVTCLLLAASPARADFRLLEERTLGGIYSATLLYEARPAPEPYTQTLVVEHPLYPDRTEELVLDGSDLDAETESALVAVEHGDTSAWTLTVEALSPAGIDASSAVAMDFVRMGPVTGVQITVNPRQADGSERLDKIRISLSGPVESHRLRGAEVSLAEYPAAQRLLRSAFLNGDTITTYTMPQRRARRALAVPPGQFRVTYSGGDEILAVPFTSFGATAADLADVGVVHHDEILTAGGIINDSIWFYAPRRHTLDDRTDSVFVSVDTTTTSLAMISRPAFNTLTPQGTEVAIPRTLFYEENNDYERFALYPVQTKFFWHFARYPASGSFGPTYTHSVDFFDKLDSLVVDFTARFYSHNSQVAVNPDHYADFELGGIAIPRFSWEGRAIHDQVSSVTLALQPTGSLSFKHTIPSGTPPTSSGADLQFFDTLELRYTGYPRVDASNKAVVQLDGDVAPRRVTIGGLPSGTISSDVVLLDITDEYTPKIVTLTNSHLFTSDGLVAVEFEAEATTSTYHLQYIPSITIISATAAETLPASPSAQLKGIYVRPPQFASSLQPLISLRGANSIVELDPQAAYNAFNGGQESPEAIRRALANIVDEAPSAAPMPWILLVGHASLDPRDYLGLITTPQVPTFIESSLFIIQSSGFMENAVDYQYGLLSGNDSLPDAMVGRIPARTTADVDLAVERILLHEDAKITLSSNNRPGLFISSTGADSALFAADQPLFASYYAQSGNTTGIIYESSYPANATGRAAMHADIVSSMTLSPAGLGLVMYTGHGFNNQWNRPEYMESAKVPNIDTEGKWPVVATFTCLNGYFAFPGNSVLTLGEAWLFSTQTGTVRGAIANMAPAGVDYYPNQRLFALAVIDPFSLPDGSRPASVGELMTMAQISFATDYPGLTATLHEAILFGDPASSLALDDVENNAVNGWLFLE